MHIGFLSTQMGTPGGPALVDQRSLQHIAELDRQNSYTIYSLKKGSTDGLQICKENFQIRDIRPSGKWLGVAFGVALEIKRNPVDLLHASFVPPPFVPSRFVMTMTCWSQYDEPKMYPRLIRWRLIYLLNSGVRRASAIFCYTEYLKQKVMEKFNIDPERIFITQPGIGEEMKPITDRDSLDSYRKRLGIDGPYILFIGALTKRKNVPRLIEAYYRLVQESKIPHKLVLVGENLFFPQEIFATIEKLGLSDRIVLPGQRPHSELPWLYNGADVYVFPSLSEGFGLTPVEAMACGTPVVASNVTCVPEVVGDGAAMVNPKNTDEIAQAILGCLTDQQFRSDLIQRGMKNAKRYCWDKAARQLVSGYETVHEAGW